MNTCEYIDAATRRPWLYGGGPGGFRGHDCTLFPANWCWASTGRDPASDLRETYTTKEGAEAVLEKAGGYFGIMAGRLLSCGWRFVDEPTDGVVAIIDVPCGRRRFDFPAIRYRDRWVLADPRGLIGLDGSLPHRFMWSAT